QVIAPRLELSLPTVDLTELADDAREQEAQRLSAEEARRSFNLSEIPLLRAILIALDLQDYILLLTMHHIISDGWSMGIVVREMALLYEAFSKCRPSTLAELPLQYGDFTLWQREWLQTGVLEDQLAYWRQKLGCELRALQLPTDRPRPPIQTYRGATERF